MARAAITTENRSRRRIPWWLRFTLPLVALAVIGVAAEFGCRLLGVRPRTATALHVFFRPDAEAGWRGRPDAACRFATVDFDSFVQHGPDGFRQVAPRRIETVVNQRLGAAGDVAMRPPVDSGLLKASHVETTKAAVVASQGKFEGTSHVAGKPSIPEVWFVGDSMTWGWGVNNGETFVDLLAGADPGRRYRNLSAPGYSAIQEAMLLRDLLRTEPTPEIVVVVFTNNDLPENFAGSRRDTMRPHFVQRGQDIELADYPVPPFHSTNLHTRMKQISIAYNLLHFHLLNARTAIRNYRTRGIWSAPPAVTDLQWKGMSQSYAQMKSDCDRRGAKMAVVYIPGPCEVTTTHRWNWPEYQKDVRRGLEALTADLSIPLWDTTERFARHFREGSVEAMTFQADPHLSPTGHRLVAEALAARFLP